MNKYQFIEDLEQNPVILQYGQLGTCQLLVNKQTQQLCVLKLASKIEAGQDVRILSQINHPNIIRILQYFDHEDNVLIIFQLLENGDLYTKLKCKQIKQQNILPIIRGICQAISYIHYRKIIHRNLKTETILMDSNMNPKIIDFGLAARLSTRRTLCGCLLYMSPQLLKNQLYNEKADIWALGVILHQLVFGDVPFHGQSAQEVLKSIKNSSFIFQGTKNKYKQLILLMLNQQPKNRPSINEVLMYPLLKQNKVKDQSSKANGLKYKREPMINKLNAKEYEHKLFQHFYSQKTNSKAKREQTQPSFWQNLKINLKQKYKAWTDSQIISRNPHYNFYMSHH